MTTSVIVKRSRCGGSAFEEARDDIRMEAAGEFAAGGGAVIPDDAGHERPLPADLQPHDAFRRQRLVDEDAEARAGEIGDDARHAVRADRLDLAVAMREVAGEAPWTDRLAAANAEKVRIAGFGDYRRWLIEAGCRVDIWQTTYVHALANLEAIAEWFKSTGLKPYLDRLPAEEQKDFLARYLERIAPHYPVESDGNVLLRFPRLFVVAVREG